MGGGVSSADVQHNFSLVRECVVACEQCEFIARKLTVEQYTQRRATHRSIGEHLRHCLEHFQILLKGISCGYIDYDARTRDEEVERSPTKFLDAMGDVLRRLKALEHEAMDMMLCIRTLGAPNGEKSEVASTLGRELAFLSSHTIHHVAIVTLLAESMGISLPEGYGVAYSTNAYRASLVTAPMERARTLNRKRITT